MYDPTNIAMQGAMMSMIGNSERKGQDTNIEQRLARIENKLDELIKKLDKIEKREGK